MEKNKDNGLSIADIVCTIGLIVMLLCLFCGLCYNRVSLGTSIAITLVAGLLLLLALIGAIGVKKSKPYNQTVWRVVEYGTVAGFLILSAIAFIPINRFINIEWAQSDKISDALDADRQHVDAQVAEFQRKLNDNMQETARGLGNYLYAHENNGAGASQPLLDFINETFNASGRGNTHGINQLTTRQIDIYKNDREEKINSFSESYLPYYQKEDHYRQANMLGRCAEAPELIAYYHQINEEQENFCQDPDHKYPVILRETGIWTIAGRPAPVVAVNDQSQFEKALDESNDLNWITVLVYVVLNLMILMPYIVTLRQKLVRTVTKKGRDIGGRPLTELQE